MIDYDKLYQKLQNIEMIPKKKPKIIGIGKNTAESKHKIKCFMFCVVFLPHINVLCISNKSDYIYVHPHVKLVELGYELNNKALCENQIAI